MECASPVLLAALLDCTLLLSRCLRVSGQLTWRVRALAASALLVHRLVLLLRTSRATSRALASWASSPLGRLARVLRGSRWVRVLRLRGRVRLLRARCALVLGPRCRLGPSCWVRALRRHLRVQASSSAVWTSALLASSACGRLAGSFALFASRHGVVMRGTARILAVVSRWAHGGIRRGRLLGSRSRVLGWDGRVRQSRALRVRAQWGIWHLWARVHRRLRVLAPSSLPSSRPLRALRDLVLRVLARRGWWCGCGRCAWCACLCCAASWRGRVFRRICPSASRSW
jgi:hypothetical protein